MKIIDYSDIKVCFLSKSTDEHYLELMKAFNSHNQNINMMVKNRVSILKGKQCYDNRDVIMLFINKETDDLIGLVSFAASSLRDKAIKDEEIIYPAVVINTFSIQKKYSKKEYNVRLINGDLLSPATFILEFLMDYLDKCSSEIGITHVYLFSERNKYVQQFYESHNFVEFNASDLAFGRTDLDNSYKYLRTLKNAVNRELQYLAATR